MSTTNIQSAPVNSRSRVIIASLVGTSIEFYDFYVYATAAVLIFPTLFFPNQDATTALLSSFAVFGVAFIARPVGSIVFGHFGDRVGRKGTLVVTLLTMGIATFLIGCLPSANTPGWQFWAPFLLVLLRFSQGFGLGGEWSGAALLATENAPENKRTIYGTFPQLGAPIGFISANLLFILLNATLSTEAFFAWGWRIPFLMSMLLAVVGVYIRLTLVETPAFQQVQETKSVARMPIARVFVTSWRQVVLGTFIMLATYVLFYIMTVFVFSYGTTTTDAELPGLGYSRNDFLWILVIGEVFFGIFIFLAGPIAERNRRKKLLIWTTVGIFAYGFLFVPLLAGGFVGVLTFYIVGYILMGLTYGPMGSELPELFPANVRYTGSAISYNMGSILGAAVAPVITIELWRYANGSLILVGFYLSAAALITIIALLLSDKMKKVDYASNVS